MNFGKVTKPVIPIGDNGSFKQETITYRKGEAVSKTRYEIRVRVNNETEELAEYVKHKREHLNQNIEFKVDRGNPGKDYYHVIKIWEE